MNHDEPLPQDRYARAIAVAAHYREQVRVGSAGSKQELLAAHPDLRGLLEALLEVSGARQCDTHPVGSDHVTLPSRIGNYEIVRVLGSGGMGTVYLAVQTTPVRRQVALKTIRDALGGGTVVKRFAAERQALALMANDYIAKVFDAGVSDLGTPYIAMEYVDGLPLCEFCDRQQLDTKARLHLFQRVCIGVQHAHEAGIIHRDLKPSNILVTSGGEEPMPKIIDFGIAKAPYRQLLDTTLQTVGGQVMGTPDYMSPEQAGIVELQVDSRTDVYSLGVILYELLVGERPFAPLESNALAMVQLRDRFEDYRPPRPSTHFRGRAQDRADAADRRRTSSSNLLRILRRDLDWIVLRAIEKDRSRRYDGPAGLAEDIARYLRNQPVLAGPPSALYRLRKFAQRNRANAAALALGALTLLLGALLANVMAFDRGRASDFGIDMARAVVTIPGSAAGAGVGSDVAVLADANDDGVDELVVAAPNLAGGVVNVLSGADGSTLFRCAGATDGDRLGAVVAVIGDVDGDAHDDLLLLAGSGGRVGAGYLRVCSGRTGALVHHVDADGPLLASACAVGDVDGDGSGDFAVGTVDDAVPGCVRLYSGRTAAVLRLWQGRERGDHFGASVAAVGDVDGDGSVDLVVGAPRGGSPHAPFVGYVRLVSGQSNRVLHELVGDWRDDAFGAAVLAPGDLDGDGILDFVVGAPGDDNRGTDSGTVFACSGATASVLFFADGFGPGDRFGAALASVADLDGDETVDLAIGSPFDDDEGDDCGSVRFLSGRSGASLLSLRGQQSNERFGTAVTSLTGSDGLTRVLVGAPFASAASAGSGRAVLSTIPYVASDACGVHPDARCGYVCAGAGDVNRDGVEDLAFAAPEENGPNGIAVGRVSVLSGRDGHAIWVWRGARSREHFGSCVAGAGDVDGDGWDDVAVGAGGRKPVRAAVYSGRTGQLLTEHVGPRSARDGWIAVAGVGDLDGDGCDEVAIGTPAGDPELANGRLDSGVVTVVGMVGDRWRTFVEIDAPADYERFGWSLCGVRDVNDDGRPDIAVGSYTSALNGAACGAVRVFSGTVPAIELATFAGEPGDYFGHCIANVGDLDGDGCDEIVAGAPCHQGNRGCARVLSVRAGRTLMTLAGRSSGDFLGYAVGPLGDVDGDGVPDIVIGAWGDDRAGVDAGSAITVSGKNGSVLQRWFGDRSGDNLGVSVGGLRDRTGRNVGVCFGANRAGLGHGGMVRWFQRRANAVGGLRTTMPGLGLQAPDSRIASVRARLSFRASGAVLDPVVLRFRTSGPWQAATLSLYEVASDGSRGAPGPSIDLDVAALHTTWSGTLPVPGLPMRELFLSSSGTRDVERYAQEHGGWQLPAGEAVFRRVRSHGEQESAPWSTLVERCIAHNAGARADRMRMRAYRLIELKVRDADGVWVRTVPLDVSDRDW